MDGGKKKRLGLSLKSSKKTVSAKSQNQTLGKYLTKSQEKTYTKKVQILDVPVSNAGRLPFGQTSQLDACQDVPGLFVVPNEIRNKMLELMPAFFDWKKMKPVPNSPVIESFMVPDTDASINQPLMVPDTDASTNQPLMVPDTDANQYNQTAKHKTQNSLESKTNTWKDIPRCKYDNLRSMREEMVRFEFSKDENFKSNLLVPLGPLEFDLKSVRTSETQQVQTKGEETKLKPSSQLVKVDEGGSFQSGERGISESENNKVILSSLLQNKTSELLSGIDISDIEQSVPEGTFMSRKRHKGSSVSPLVQSCHVHKKLGTDESPGLLGQICSKKLKVVQCSDVSTDNNDYQGAWDDDDDEISKYNLDIFTNTMTDNCALDAKSKQSRNNGKNVRYTFESRMLEEECRDCLLNKKGDDYNNVSLAGKTQPKGSKTAEQSQKWQLFKDNEIAQPISSTDFSETSSLQREDYCDIPESHFTVNKMCYVNKVHEKSKRNFSVNLDRGETSTSFAKETSRCLSREKLVGVNTKTEIKGSRISPIIICDDEQGYIGVSISQDNKDTTGHQYLLKDNNDNLDDFLSSFESDLDDQDLLSCYDEAMSPMIPVRGNNPKDVAIQNHHVKPKQVKRRLEMPERWQPKIRQSNESTLVSSPHSRGTLENKSKPDQLKECPICLEHFEPGFSSHDINQHIMKCEQIVNDDDDVSLWCH